MAPTNQDLNIRVFLRISDSLILPQNKPALSTTSGPKLLPNTISPSIYEHETQLTKQRSIENSGEKGSPRR